MITDRDASLVVAWAVQLWAGVMDANVQFGVRGGSSLSTSSQLVLLTSDRELPLGIQIG